MIDLVKELDKVMGEKGFSCDTMSRFIGCSSRMIDRWLQDQNTPSYVYQQLIKKGIKKVRKL